MDFHDLWVILGGIKTKTALFTVRLHPAFALPLAAGTLAPGAVEVVGRASPHSVGGPSTVGLRRIVDTLASPNAKHRPPGNASPRHVDRGRGCHAGRIWCGLKARLTGALPEF